MYKILGWVTLYYVSEARRMTKDAEDIRLGSLTYEKKKVINKVKHIKRKRVGEEGWKWGGGRKEPAGGRGENRKDDAWG